jgi:hypothetical protein
LGWDVAHENPPTGGPAELDEHVQGRRCERSLAAKFNHSRSVRLALELRFDQGQFRRGGDPGHAVQIRRRQKGLQIIAFDRADVFDFEFGQ